MSESTKRNEAVKYIELNLGGGMVDVELDKEHYDMALDKAISKYRQRSSRAVEEAFLVLNFVPKENVYYLPDEVIEVKQVYRRSSGGISASATDFEPFEAGYLSMYMLNVAKGGGLATFELYMGYREQMGKMFGTHVMFTWNQVSKKLTLHRYIRGDEGVILHTYNYKPDEMLLTDTSSGPWIRDYALSVAKMSLGQARSKYGTLAGPQGGVTLNGGELIAQAQSEQERLEEELKTYAEGGTPLGFIFG